MSERNDINIDVEEGIKISITPTQMFYLLQKLSPKDFVKAFHEIIKIRSKLECLAEQEILYQESQESDWNKRAEQGLCGELPTDKQSELCLVYTEYCRGVKEGWQTILSSINRFNEFFQKKQKLNKNEQDS